MRTPLAVALDADLAAVEQELAPAEAHHAVLPMGEPGSWERKKWLRSWERLVRLNNRRESLLFARRAAFVPAQSPPPSAEGKD